jgi:hypothetical protein
VNDKGRYNSQKRAVGMEAIWHPHAQLGFCAGLAVLPIFCKCGNDSYKMGEKEWGKAVISIAAKNNPGGIEEGAIIFDFQGAEV